MSKATQRSCQRYKKQFDDGVAVVCGLCNQIITAREEISIDHVYPKSLGGTDYMTNLQPAHKRCNNIKGTGTPAELERFHRLKGIKL